MVREILTDEDFMKEKASTRGGCLDGIVQIATFGKLGVETYIKQVEGIVPTDVTQIGSREWEYERNPRSAVEIAFQTGKAVTIQNYSPQIGRRIVRNK